MKVIVIATPCKGGDLKPGDLFSTMGPTYWNNFASKRSIGEAVYIRTETPASEAPDVDTTTVYKIKILEVKDILTTEDLALLLKEDSNGKDLTYP